MIADLLDPSYVLAQARAQRYWLSDLLRQARAQQPAALQALERHRVSGAQIETVIAALDASLAAVAQAGEANSAAAFLPSNPVLCAFQAGLTVMAERRANLVSTPPAATAIGSHSPLSSLAGPPGPGMDTSATERLRRRADVGVVAGPENATVKAPFVEGEDLHYGLDGFTAKFGALFTGRHPFNPQAAQPARSSKPLRLFIFGDWGTGLPLAQKVAEQIRKQLSEGDGSRQQHVVHLGDVYYVGNPSEYSEHVLAAGMWPVTGAEKEAIGSWSLNGNHDMYVGGFGYFQKLLRDGRFLRWHRDAAGEPSSFFVIEDRHWQFFGLDTAWNTPSLADTVLRRSTFAEYGGQNGALTPGQVAWMAKHRNVSKGCVLLTHHPPASSRTSETQHADAAVQLLKAAGVYDQIDAWLWGHEHRCVIFKPKSQRTTPRLADAPEFCACIGHGGVPVTRKNFEADKKVADVAWEEDRFDETAPRYEGDRILPFGFARIDTAPGALDIRVFDHTGSERYQTRFQRP